MNDGMVQGTTIAEVVLRLDALGRENEVLHGEIAALRAAISRIQDLHKIGVKSYIGYGQNLAICKHCGEIWPCPTIAAISKVT